jgi:hypothetical protein
MLSLTSASSTPGGHATPSLQLRPGQGHPGTALLAFSGHLPVAVYDFLSATFCPLPTAQTSDDVLRVTSSADRSTPVSDLCELHLTCIHRRLAVSRLFRHRLLPVASLLRRKQSTAGTVAATRNAATHVSHDS